MLSILSKIQKTIPIIFRFQFELLLKIRPIFKAIDVVQRSAYYLVISIIYPEISVCTAVRNLKKNDSSKITVSFVLVIVLISLGGFQEKAKAEAWITYASPCAPEEEKIADKWEYYEPEEAYQFGKKIQRLVRNQDLEGILQLVDGELIYGPTKSFIKSKSFYEVFSKKWMEAMLSDEPSCSPIGWRGFSYGPFWYQKRFGNWHIFSILGLPEEPKRVDAVGWQVNGRLLHPKCFTTEWFSGDNLEELSNYYGCDVFESPGICLGKEITDFSPISWCTKGRYCSELSLAHSVEKCSPEDFAYEIYDGWVFTDEVNESDSVLEKRKYSVLDEVSADNCSKLAPNLNAKCLGSYLVQVGENGRGSMGWTMGYGIFGVFDLYPIGISVVPLKFFYKRNDGLNFMDEMASKANL